MHAIKFPRGAARGNQRKGEIIIPVPHLLPTQLELPTPSQLFLRVIVGVNIIVACFSPTMPCHYLCLITSRQAYCC
jgi:hypothetical protein